MTSNNCDKEQRINKIELECDLIIQDLLVSDLHKLETIDVRGLKGEIIVPKTSGLYLIYQNNALVYAGKASGLRGRLATHVAKLTKADRIDKDEIAFKFVDYPHHIAVIVEDLIIKRLSPPWNSQGFGSNPAGKGRTEQEISLWQSLYMTSKLEDYLSVQITNLEDI